MPQVTHKFYLSLADKQAMAQDIFEKLLAMSFEQYDATKTYKVGDFRVYESPADTFKLYRCKTEISVPEAWTSGHWELATFQDLINDVADAVQFVNGKANVDGNYPTLTAGQALSLYSDREIEDADQACPPITIGTAGGTAEIQTGYHEIEEIRGKTVKWNQCLNLTGQPASATSDGLTFNRDNNGLMTVSGTATASGNTGFLPTVIVNQSRPLITGHKYLLKLHLTGDIGTAKFACSGLENSIRQDGIYTAIAGGTMYGQFWYVEGETYDISYKPEIFDLTDIYGVGNEPESVVEFNRTYRKSGYGFNVGNLISSKSLSIESIGMNQFDGELEIGALSDGSPVSTTQAFRSKNYIEVVNGDIYKFSVNNAGQNTISSYQVYLYDGDKNYVDRIVKYSNNSNIDLSDYPQVMFVKIVCYTNNVDAVLSDVEINFRLYWDTENVPHKPHEKQTINLPNIELRSAGSAYDVIYPSGGGKRRVGVVDLGSINWYPQTSYTAYSAGIQNLIKKPSAYNVKANIVCSKYDCKSEARITVDDKMIAVSTAGTILINDSDLSGMTNEQIKSALSGVMLYYELDEETNITEQENPGFTKLLKVDNYGVIKFNSEQAIQVPQAYFIRYTVSLSEWVDTAYEHTGGDAKKIALTEDVKKTKIDFSSSLVVDGSTNLTEYRKELYFVKSKNSIKLFCYYSAKNETESAVNGVRIINTNLTISDEFIASNIKDAIGNPLSNATASAIGCLIQAINNDGAVSLKGIRLSHSSTNQITFYDGSAINIPANGIVEISIEKEWFVEDADESEEE